MPLSFGPMLMAITSAASAAVNPVLRHSIPAPSVPMPLLLISVRASHTTMWTEEKENENSTALAIRVEVSIPLADQLLVEAMEFCQLPQYFHLYPSRPIQ
jgi:hypothetical protein